MLGHTIRRVESAIGPIFAQGRSWQNSPSRWYGAELSLPAAWHIDLVISKSLAAWLEGSLSEQEQSRAARYVRTSDRNRYIASRAALRHVLSVYLGTVPSTIAYDVTPRGRPILKATPLPSPISFNLSHSGDRALIGIADSGQIGVDMEVISDRPDVLAIAKRHFAESEFKILSDADEHRRRLLFYRMWTRKEACLKAIGIGLRAPLSAVVCKLDDRGRVYVSRLSAPLDQTQIWSTIPFDDDAVAACAVIVGPGLQGKSPQNGNIRLKNAS